MFYAKLQWPCQKYDAKAPKPTDIAIIEAPMTIKVFTRRVTLEWEKAKRAPRKKTAAPSINARSDIILGTDLFEK